MFNDLWNGAELWWSDVTAVNLRQLIALVVLIVVLSVMLVTSRRIRSRNG